MFEQHNKPADQLALFGFAQAFYLLRDILNIGGSQIARAQQRRLLVGPGLVVLIIQR